MNNCLTCYKETNNPKFCSKSCAAKLNNKIPKRKAKVSSYKCKSCGCDVGYRRTFCDMCLSPKDYTIEECMYTAHHRSSCYALIRSRARGALKNRDKICVNCGYEKHVEVCHIQPISKFALDTRVSVVNSDTNLVLLCPNCHWEFDNDLLKL